MDGKGKEWRGPAGERVSEQCFTPPPTQYKLYGRRFLPVMGKSQIPISP